MKGQKKYCAGCYDDVYNHGLGGSRECWHLEDSKVVKRKEVHINDVPPWKHQTIKKVNNCYNKSKHVYVNPERDH